MNRTIYSFNDFHLGDNLIFLHLLRSIAKQRVSQLFVHFCGAHHHAQLSEVVSDLPNILLESFESPLWAKHHKDAINVWKNAEDAWVNSPLRWDWSAYTLWHHGVIARRMGFENPFSCREHLLFDYPELHRYVYVGWPFDFMVLTCEPCSGQFRPMARHGSRYLDALIVELSKKNTILVVGPTEVPETDHLRHLRPQKTITQIGYESIYCRNHVMVATGPMFPTLSTHNHHANEGRHRIVLLDNGEQLNMPGITQVSNVEQVFEIAREQKWI